MSSFTPNLSTMSTDSPAVTAGSGSFTSVTGTTRFLRLGKLVFIRIEVTITTNGTAGTFIQVALPVTSANIGVGKVQMLAGREVATTGFSVMGTINNSSLVMTIRKYDNTYLGADGYVFVVEGWYEAA